MAMSKKDFIAIADALRPILTGPQVPEVYRVDIVQKRTIDTLCAFMRAQNPRFNEERWRAYLMGECGPSGGKVKGSEARKARELPAPPYDHDKNLYGEGIGEG